jgi:hypothetical protein
LKELILKYEGAFQWSQYDIGTTQVVKYNIDTGNAKPIKQKQYRMPQTA